MTIPTLCFLIPIRAHPMLRHVLQARTRKFPAGCRLADPAERSRQDAGSARSFFLVSLNLWRRRLTEVEGRPELSRGQERLCLRALFAGRLPRAEARGRSLRWARYSCLRAGAWRNLRCPAGEPRARVEVRRRGWEKRSGHRMEERRPSPADRADFGAAVRGPDPVGERRQNSAVLEQGG